MCCRNGVNAMLVNPDAANKHRKVPNDLLLVPKSVRGDLSIDSFQCSSQHSSGSNFFEAIDAIFEHPANGIFPSHRLDHLPAE